MSSSRKTIIWLPETYSDLERLDSFLRPLNATASDFAIDAILETASSLPENPKRGTIIDPEKDIRQIPVSAGKYGYIIWYRVKDDRIEIIRVWHGKENRLTD